MPSGSRCSSAGWHAPRCRRSSRMLRIEHFYVVLAAFLLYAGWCNLRERRFAHAAFWSILAALFGSGELILTASKAGDKLPAQVAGAAVIALGVLATRMRREHIAEAPE